ncbi:MAG: hypothetical protein JXR03_01890 [Cyclobacteriaceae bacterium]
MKRVRAVRVEILLLLIMSLVFSCRSLNSSNSSFQGVYPDSADLTVDSLSIFIKAIDLSEDLSRFSSNNDELLILVYEMNDSLTLGEPLLKKEINLDSAISSKTLVFESWNEPLNGKLFFILIEQDSETPIEQIDPILRVHYKKIAQLFESRNYLGLETYLGDEDVLGIEILEKHKVANEGYAFIISGVYKLDKYKYSISISPLHK